MGFTELMAALHCCADATVIRSRETSCAQCPYRFLGEEECRRRVVRGAAQYIDQLQTLLVMTLGHTLPEVEE